MNNTLSLEERLKEAKKLYESANKDQKYILESLFPELRESGDERIRKAILELVRQSSAILDKQNQNNMIAWLEKQKINPYSGVSFEYNGNTWGMYASARDNGVEILFNGKLKAFLSSEKSFLYPIHSELVPKSAKEVVNEEKVDNQNCVKPTDNVE